MASLELQALAARLGGPAEGEGELELPGCLATVRRMTGLLRQEAHREMADESIFQKLLQILRKASCEFDVACKDTTTLDHRDSCLLLLTEIFRCLRNACVQSASNQNVMRNLGLIDASVHLIQLLQKLETDLESLLTALRCSLQYLGNMAAGNGDSQDRIWNLAFPSVFLNCLNIHDEKITAYCCMVLLTCLNPERMIELQEGNNLNVALAVLQAFKRYPESEWVFLVNNHLLKCPKLVKAMYAKMSNQERITLLELILSQTNDKKSIISEEITTFLASSFEEKCHAVLRLASSTDNEDKEALVTIRLLDVLCEMASNSEQLECLQACPNLLEVAINTLKLTHIAGKQATNIFTVTHSAPGKEEISHPAVGFKSHLIRLIGNLCYKNKVNQDKVYELDGIPLILDNCSIDDNNPFCLLYVKLLYVACKPPFGHRWHREQCPELPLHFPAGCLLAIPHWLILRDKCQFGNKWAHGPLCSNYGNCGRTLSKFISQWAVYTIHNLTELNERNQELIAQMEQRGLADSSVLESMGLKVEEQDEKLILRSVRKMPNL